MHKNSDFYRINCLSGVIRLVAGGITKGQRGFFAASLTSRNNSSSSNQLQTDI
jgi:hypothetical protein